MVNLPEQTANDVTQYLATHFPPSDRDRPNLVAGNVTVTFREWTVPTLGQRARDPFQTADGTIWWTGQFASVVGRLNPQTGEMREWKLETEAHPHSIVMGPDGNVWYTGNGNGTIGKLRPDSGEITVYRMPDPAARDPHTPAFDRNGTLWFTLQGSNMVGRMNIQTGDVKFVTMPRQNARPYGIKIDSQGTPWVAYRNANAIARVDPGTMEVREYTTWGTTNMSNPQAGSRRLAIDSRDNIWFVESYRGYIGRLDPRTGDVKQWPSPSGPDSHPYAIAVVNDIVWYNESGKRPDALVRFDPATETFQSWPIPSGVGIIRNMSSSPDGKLVIHQSSTNKVGLAIIESSDSQTRR
jgi:virginiamycin B lyase